MKFKNSYAKEVVIEVFPGSTVDESVKEVFNWFYNQHEIDKCTMPHVNGVSVIFERHP